MRDTDPSFLDKYVPPTDEQLAKLGSVMASKIRLAIIQDRLSGYEDQPYWMFDVEGHGGLIDREGFVRSGQLLIVPDELSTEETGLRSFRLVASKSRITEDEDEFVAEIFRIGVLKNTETVADVRRATVSGDYLEDPSKRFGTRVSELIDNPVSAIRTAITREYDAIKEFGRELESQTDIGHCSESEVRDLIEVLERAQPI